MENNSNQNSWTNSPGKKLLIIFIVVFVFFDALIFINKTSFKTQKSTGQSQASAEVQENNVSMVDGKQIITLTAKGGYSPRKSKAKAGVPTILKVSTNGTFDCSSSIRIPALQLSKNLPTTGETEIDLGNPKVGVFNGTCGMGMYPFEIEFQS